MKKLLLLAVIGGIVYAWWIHHQVVINVQPAPVTTNQNTTPIDPVCMLPQPYPKGHNCPITPYPDVIVNTGQKHD